MRDKKSMYGKQKKQQQMKEDEVFRYAASCDASVGSLL